MLLKRHAGPGGFLLVEVLVAMLLAALGVITLSALHAAALQATRANLHRVTATQLASDLAERMRANRAGVGLGAASPYQFTLAGVSVVDPAASMCDGPAAVCSAADLARADIAQWRLLLGRALPSASARVQLDLVLSVADIWISWRDAAGRDEPAPAPDCADGAGVGGGSVLRCVSWRVAW